MKKFTVLFLALKNNKTFQCNVNACTEKEAKIMGRSELLAENLLLVDFDLPVVTVIRPIINNYVGTEPKETLATLFQLAMTQPSYEFDVFVNIYGHVKAVQVQVISKCTYKAGESQNIVFDVTLYQDSDIFAQELRIALSDVVAIISQQKIQGAA